MLIAAFILGFTGSLHCIGMCGPIAIMINGHSARQIFLNRIFYNFGRVVTYVFMGSIAGLLGRIIQLRGLQGKLSVAIGILIIVLLLIPKIQSLFLPSISGFVLKLKKSFAVHIQSRRPVSAILTGMMNGYLPCGLVYGALAIALVQPTVLESAIVMVLFGMGTIPALLATAYSWETIRKFIPFSFQRIQTMMLVIVAVGMIWRGLTIETHLFHGHGPDVVCVSD